MIVKKIDIHSHCLKEHKIPFFWSGDGTSDFLTPDEMRESMEYHNVEKSVLLPIVASEHYHQYLNNEVAEELYNTYPDMFYWFCCIDPRWGGDYGKSDMTYFLEYYKARGAKGIGEITANIPFDDHRVWNLFKAAEKCDMPVLFHIGPKDMEYGLVDELGLPRLERSLKQFPNLKFIGHSAMFWAEISSDATEENRNDYPTGPVTPGRVPYLMEHYQNLYCDVSAGSGGNAIMRDEAFGISFLEKYQDRIFFGMDVCGAGSRMELSFYLDKLVESGKLSQTAYNKICRENALKILEA